MFDPAQEELEAEFNARFDYVREAYAATALDPYQEGYSDYCFNQEDAGEEILDFATWKASLRRPSVAPLTWTQADLDDFPF